MTVKAIKENSIWAWDIGNRWHATCLGLSLICAAAGFSSKPRVAVLEKKGRKEKGAARTRCKTDPLPRVNLTPTPVFSFADLTPLSLVFSAIMTLL